MEPIKPRKKLMPISLKKLLGRKLGASDGEIGLVKDFYFEDQRWALRYVIADTGSWLAGRLVLLSPYSFERIDQNGGCLPIKLTRQQIEDSPAIELHKPISRRYEEAYHVYYGLAPYWNEGGVWGGVAGLQADKSSDPRSFAQANIASQPNDSDDLHLRSTESIIGYELQSSDGVIGSVTDFLVDDYGWMIRYVVFETGNWFSGKEVKISPQDIVSVSYAEAKIFVRLTKEALMEAAEKGNPVPV
jgi:hypothetical protein